MLQKTSSMAVDAEVLYGALLLAVSLETCSMAADSYLLDGSETATVDLLDGSR